MMIIITSRWFLLPQLLLLSLCFVLVELHFIATTKLYIRKRLFPSHLITIIRAWVSR